MYRNYRMTDYTNYYMHYSEELDSCQEASARGHVGKGTNQGSHIDYTKEKPDLRNQMGMRRASIWGLLAAIS